MYFQQRFYGSKPRRMGLGLGLSRLTVWRNLLRAQKKGYQGNKKGDQVPIQVFASQWDNSWTGICN